MRKIIQILMVATLLLAITGYSHAQTGIQITINPSPTLYSVTGGGTYCAGLSGVPVGLTGSETSVSYQLLINSIPSGLPIAGTGSPLNFGNQLMTGTYTVEATSTTTGCSIMMSNQALVQVNPIPSITLTASGPVEFCGSGSVTLTANAGSGHTYQWFKNGSSISGANLNQYVANSTGMYTVLATSTATGCSNDNDTMVMVNPLPQVFTVSASAANFCEGSAGVTINLNGSQTGVNYQLMIDGVPSGVAVAGTGYALNWTNQNHAGTYSVVAEDNLTGCTSVMTGSPVVAINPIPDDAFTVVGPTSVCQGEIVSFSTSMIPNATSYIWSVPMGATIMSGMGTTSITVQFNGSTSGDVTVFGQNTCGGGQPFIYPVTVNVAPTLGITASASDICEGVSATLTATGTGTSFVWSGGLGTTNFITVTPTATTTYTVTATGTNGCTADENMTIHVHTAPSVSLDLTEDEFCMDVNSSVISGGLPAGGTYSGSCVFGGNTIYPPVSGPGTYTITYTYDDGYGCSSSATDLLTINPLPVVMFVNVVGAIHTDTPPFDLTAYVSPIGGTFSGPGMVGSMFDPESAGVETHMIEYTYTHPATGCSASQIQYITVGTTDVDDITAIGAINIYPNPVADMLFLAGINKEEIISFQIVDITGRVISEQTNLEEVMQLDVVNFTPGTYMIRFFDRDGMSVSKKFLKN